VIEDFKGHPQSIAEIKADREGDGSLWTPRDALISLLREIDEGRNVSHMVICFDVEDQTPSGTRRNLSYCCAGPRSRHEAIGLVEAVKGMMLGFID